MNKLLRIVNSSLFKQMSTVFIWSNIAKVVGVITTVLLIRNLTKGDFAYYTFFYTAANFFIGLIVSGIDMSYVRFAAEEFSVSKRMPLDIFIFSIILCLISFCAFLPIILIFGKQISYLLFKDDAYTKLLVFGYFSALVTFMVTIVSRFYQIKEHFGRAGLIISLEKILFLLVFLFAVLFSLLSIDFIIIAQIIISLIFSLIFVYIFYKNEYMVEKIHLNWERFLVFLKASFWLILYYVTFALFGQLDVFMIARMGTVDDLANYGVAFKYYGFLMILFPSIKTVLKVRTSKIDMINDMRKQLDFFKKWMKIVSIVIAPLIVVIILVSDYLMNWLNGQRYASSVLSFKLLALSAIFSYLFSPITDVFRCQKKYFLLFCFGFLALVLNFFGNLLLIPLWSINGAAVATLAANLLINLCSTLYIFKNAKV